MPRSRCPCKSTHSPEESCTLQEGAPFYAWGYGLAPEAEYAWVVPCTTREEAELMKEFFFQVAGFLGAGSAKELPAYPRSYRLYVGAGPLIYRWAPALLQDALAWSRAERTA